MGFRFYSGAADTYTSPQEKGPQLAIKPTVTWHTMASEITGARFAIPDKCSVADLNTPPPPFSLVSFAVPFCQVAHRRKSQMAASAYWGK